jgi:hypothetical protein
MSDQKHFADSVRNVGDVRKSQVRRMREDVQATLARYRAARRQMSTDTQASLRKTRAGITASVGNVRYERRLMVDQAGRATHGSLEDLDGIMLRPPSRSALEVNEDHVLRAIESHPEGLTLAEIGNALGVDWRVLVNLVHTLADSGAIERIEELVYPVWK